MNPRVFSVQEANELLPKLNSLTSQLVQKKEQMQKKHDQLLMLDLLSGEKIHDKNAKDHREYLQKSAELEALILSFEDDILEINRCGCYLRDIDKCAIDFFSIKKNELIYLNWQRGEDKIHYYHDVDTHFSRRKLLDEELEKDK